MSEPLLRTKTLRAGYAGSAVIRDVEIEVTAGEVVVLLGANGAGKTTTLRVCSGMVPPMEGSLWLDGSEVTGWSSNRLARHGLSHVPEGRGIFYGLTVAEHFRIGHRGAGLDKALAYEYFPSLKPIEDRRAGLLSGGEQQMLALAQVLARRPRVLMIDEMSLGLAPIIVRRILPVLRRVAKENGTGVLLVEQHVELALEIADRGYVMSHGEIVLQADADRLVADQDVILASYLGESDG